MTEELGGGVFCRCDKNHPVHQDAILLAEFAAPRSADTVCDLGTGNGILPLLWRRDGFRGELVAVEKMPGAAALARENLTQFPEDAILLLEQDLRTLGAAWQGRFSLVTMNPPYYKQNAARQSRDAERAAARFELFCTPAEVCRAAAFLLSPGGRFCLCVPPARKADYASALADSGLSVTRWKSVTGAGNEPYLFLLQAERKGETV